MREKVFPQVAFGRDSRRHGAQGESLRGDLAGFYFLPGARGRNRCAGFGANGVGCRERRAVAVASGVDENATAAIDLTELLRQMRRIAADEQLSYLMGETLHLAKLRFTIEWHGDVEA